MDKQRINIKQVSDYELCLKTNRTVTTHNPIVQLFTDEDNELCIEFRVNRSKSKKQVQPNTAEYWKYTVVMYLRDYLSRSLWAHNVKVNKGDLHGCSVVYDDGWSQVAITGSIANKVGKARAMMHNYNRVDLRGNNIFFVTKK